MNFVKVTGVKEVVTNERNLIVRQILLVRTLGDV